VIAPSGKIVSCGSEWKHGILVAGADYGPNRIAWSLVIFPDDEPKLPIGWPHARSAPSLVTSWPMSGNRQDRSRYSTLSQFDILPVRAALTDYPRSGAGGNCDVYACGISRTTARAIRREQPGTRRPRTGIRALDE